MNGHVEARGLVSYCTQDCVGCLHTLVKTPGCKWYEFSTDYVRHHFYCSFFFLAAFYHAFHHTLAKTYFLS
jgi:hypothetical protein